MIIRELQKRDLPTRVEWMNHPAVHVSMHFDIPVMIEKTINWFDNNIGNEKRSDVAFLEGERLVAFGGLTSISPSLKMAELYVFVNPNSQKSGIGTIATKLLCDWGFLKLGLRKIYLFTNEDNEPAIAVYKKCGFVLEGRHRQEYISKDGEYKDRLYFGLLKTDVLI